MWMEPRQAVSICWSFGQLEGWGGVGEAYGKEWVGLKSYRLLYPRPHFISDHRLLGEVSSKAEQQTQGV